MHTEPWSPCVLRVIMWKFLYLCLRFPLSVSLLTYSLHYLFTMLFFLSFLRLRAFNNKYEQLSKNLSKQLESVFCSSPFPSFWRRQRVDEWVAVEGITTKSLNFLSRWITQRLDAFSLFFSTTSSSLFPWCDIYFILVWLSITTISYPNEGFGEQVTAFRINKPTILFFNYHDFEKGTISRLENVSLNGCVYTAGI